MELEWSKLSLSRAEASELFNQYKTQEKSFEYNEDFSELREELKKLWKNSQLDAEHADEKNQDNAGYLRDLNFAIDFYELMTKKGFTQWEAANDNIWAGIALKVIPDIFQERWPYNDGPDHTQRWIYKRTWRVWTKTLWWFIYLTMVTDAKGNLDTVETKKRLSIFESTSIDDFLDRCGMGFRVNFCRKLIERYFEYATTNKITGSQRRKTFRFVVSQAYLHAGNIDPDLCGHDAFLNDIFSRISSK